jgi:hypothetical protein
LYRIRTSVLTAVRKRRRLGLTVIMSAFFALVAADPAGAYVLESSGWHGGPGKGVCCAYIHVQYNSNLINADAGLTNNGIRAWNASPAPVILQQLSGSLQVNSTERYDMAAPSWTSYATSGGYFTYAHIYYNDHVMANYGQPYANNIAMHELGHAMGLDHTHGCIGVMDGDVICGFTAPQQDDINGISALY